MLTLTGMNFRFICVKAISKFFLSQIIFPNEIKSGQKLKTFLEFYTDICKYSNGTHFLFRFILFSKANLEINKEGLIADLGCMLNEASGAFRREMESFFISGAARIDLIAKVIDLDNAIGGYNFDIQNLEATSNELASLRSAGGKIFCLVKKTSNNEC